MTAITTQPPPLYTEVVNQSDPPPYKFEVNIIIAQQPVADLSGEESNLNGNAEEEERKKERQKKQQEENCCCDPYEDDEGFCLYLLCNIFNPCRSFCKALGECLDSCGDGTAECCNGCCEDSPNEPPSQQNDGVFCCHGCCDGNDSSGFDCCDCDCSD